MFDKGINLFRIDGPYYDTDRDILLLDEGQSAILETHHIPSDFLVLQNLMG